MQKFILNITNEDVALIDDANLECFCVDSSINDEVITRLRDKIHSLNKIILAIGDNACDACQKFNLDGVIVDLSASTHCAKDINYTRKLIGDKFLGVISRNRRHEAMLFSECEPDFLIFKAWTQGIEKIQELVSWYNEMFLIQSAVILEEPKIDGKSFDCDIIIGNLDDYKNFCC